MQVMGYATLCTQAFACHGLVKIRQLFLNVATCFCLYVYAVGIYFYGDICYLRVESTLGLVVDSKGFYILI